MTERPRGIASQINDARAAVPQPAAVGEGVNDTEELLRLINRIQAKEAQNVNGPPDMMIGEFLVSGLRVPKSFIAGLQNSGFANTEPHGGSRSPLPRLGPRQR